MNPLDWLLALLVVYSTVRAAMRGLVRELFALGGLIVGFLLACWYYDAVAVYLRGLVNSPPLAEFCAFLLIISAVMVLAAIVGALVRRTASAVGLSVLDRLGGAAFGAARGVVLGAAVLLAITAFLPAAPWVQGSKFSPYLLRASHAVSFVMPRHLKQQLLEGLDRLKHTTPGWINYGTSSHTVS
ncbi:MAG TPA: CvpA family protein [Acidobacteriaceae bacterium]|jgi:membrane protein required for colicin V production